MGDGWYQVHGTVAIETVFGRHVVRLFAGFNKEGTQLDNQNYVLIDNVQVGKAVPAANADAAENKSSVNLITGGDLEDEDNYALGDNLGAPYDSLGWGTTEADKDVTTIMKDGGSRVLRLAGNSKNGWGSAVHKMPALTAGKTYRLVFDYKFIADTAANTMQAHVSLLNDPAKQADNPGGWYAINLIGQPGYDLDNGYKRVEMDFTPSEFEASAITDLRFFMQLGGADATTGIYFDNVALYDIAQADPLPTEVQGGHRSNRCLEGNRRPDRRGQGCGQSGL